MIPATLQDLASKKMIKEENGAKLVWVKSNKKKKAKKKKKSKQDESDGGKTQKKQGGPPEGMMDVPLIAQKSDGGYVVLFERVTQKKNTFSHFITSTLSQTL